MLKNPVAIYGLTRIQQRQRWHWQRWWNQRTHTHTSLPSKFTSLSMSYPMGQNERSNTHFIATHPHIHTLKKGILLAHKWGKNLIACVKNEKNNDLVFMFVRFVFPHLKLFHSLSIHFTSAAALIVHCFRNRKTETKPKIKWWRKKAENWDERERKTNDGTRKRRRRWRRSWEKNE